MAFQSLMLVVMLHLAYLEFYPLIQNPHSIERTPQNLDLEIQRHLNHDMKITVTYKTKICNNLYKK
jgi:hypothetical protein